MLLLKVEATDHQRAWRYLKKSVWSQNKKVMAISKCILAESEQNKLKTEDVSTIFIKDSKNLGLCTKYTQYQKLPEAISNHSVEAVTASLVLLLHRSNCLSHIYNSNSKNIRYLQPSLFHSLLWSCAALLRKKSLSKILSPNRNKVAQQLLSIFSLSSGLCQCSVSPMRNVSIAF